VGIASSLMQPPGREPIRRQRLPARFHVEQNQDWRDAREDGGFTWNKISKP